VGGSERTGIVYGLQGWFSRQKQELGERQRRVFEGLEMWELDIEGNRGEDQACDGSGTGYCRRFGVRKTETVALESDLCRGRWLML
jgi:hypothetical protein